MFLCCSCAEVFPPWETNNFLLSLILQVFTLVEIFILVFLLNGVAGVGLFAQTFQQKCKLQYTVGAVGPIDSVFPSNSLNFEIFSEMLRLPSNILQVECLPKQVKKTGRQKLNRKGGIRLSLAILCRILINNFNFILGSRNIIPVRNFNYQFKAQDFLYLPLYAPLGRFLMRDNYSNWMKFLSGPPYSFRLTAERRKQAVI